MNGTGNIAERLSSGGRTRYLRWLLARCIELRTARGLDARDQLALADRRVGRA